MLAIPVVIALLEAADYSVYCSRPLLDIDIGNRGR